MAICVRCMVSSGNFGMQVTHQEALNINNILTLDWLTLLSATISLVI